MTQRLQPLFAENEKGKMSQGGFADAIKRLKRIRRKRVCLSGAEFQTAGAAEAERREALDFLPIKLKGLQPSSGTEKFTKVAMNQPAAHWFKGESEFRKNSLSSNSVGETSFAVCPHDNEGCAPEH